MEEISRKRIIIFIIVGTLLGIIGRGLTIGNPDIPLYLNFAGVFVSSYFGGTAAGSTVSLLTVLFGIVYGFAIKYEYVYSEAACIIPMILSVMFVGNFARKYNAFEKVYNTFGTYALVATMRSFVMIVVSAVFYDGHTGITLCDVIIDYKDATNDPLLLKYLLPSTIATFVDTFITLFIFFFILKFCIFIKNRKGNKSSSVTAISIIAAGFIFAGIIGYPLETMAMAGDNFVKKQYSAVNGLLGDAANSVVQTKDGAIWVGTYGGVYKYNGEEFTMMRDMPEARSVESLYVDREDNLWISSNGTGLVVRTSGNKILSLSDEEGLPSNTIRAVTQVSKNKYYVGTVDTIAIVSFDGNSMEVIGNLPDIVYAKRLVTSDTGKVFATTSSGDVYLIKDDKVADVFDIEEKINSVWVKSDTEVYLSGENANIYVVSVKNNKFNLLETRHIDEMDSIKSILVSSENVMYLAGSSKIGFINENDAFTLVNTGDFNNSIEQIMEDYQGNIWFTSARCGLLELSASSFSNLFDICNVEKDGTNTVQYWKDCLYVGTDNGLIVLDEKKSVRVYNHYTEFFDGKRIRSLAVDSQNHLWVSTQTEGTYEIESEDIFYNYSSQNGLPDNRARFTIFLSDGRAMISTYSGIAYVENHKITNTLAINKELKSAYALCLLEVDESTVLAGTNGDGICVIKNGEVKKYITHKNGIPSGVILNIYKDKFGDGFFVLSGSGMCYMDIDYTIMEFTEFPYYNNTDIYQTSQNDVIVLSTAGLFIANYDELMEFGDVNVFHLDEKMGLPGSVTSNARNYMTDDDILYFAGSTGIYKLDCSDYSVKIKSYKINMESVQIDGNDQELNDKSDIVIPEGSKKISIKFDLFNYTTTDPYIRYILDGVDAEPVVAQASQLQEIVYYAIPSGKHSFVIEVLDTNKTEVLGRYEYTFNKLVEPYETAYFKLFYYFGLLLIGATIIIWIAIIVIDLNARKEKVRYAEAITAMEKEKSDALEKSLEREEQANRSKSEFLANMSHEIRTPINAIIGMDTMIIRESTQADIKKYAHNIYGASNTLLSLINDILDFSKIESGKMELIPAEYNLGSLINDINVMMRPKAEAKQLRFNIEANPDIPVNLYGDEGRIKQIIINILNNAVKYTEKGNVTLKVDFEKKDDKNIDLSVCVSDTGIGIKKEDLGKLFSAFDRIEENRNKNIEGTGLGMSITKKLLDLMNSELKVESVYGKGSDFSFTIKQPQMNNEKMGNYEDYASVSKDYVGVVEEFHAPEASVLVVDDVEMNLIVMTSLLKRTEIQIDTADSGIKAIEMTKVKKYDMIFLDAMMPKMDGVETLGHIRSKCPCNNDTPIIMLTANAVKGAKEEYLSKGFNDYLSKPINETELEQMIVRYLPDEKVIHISEEDKASKNESDAVSEKQNDFWSFMEGISQIDVQKGIEAAGGKDTYEMIVKNFVDTANARIKLLEDLYEKKDIENYTIQVHALKSSARIIGAIKLSELAFSMEMAGKEGNLEKINSGTEEVIEMYKAIYSRLLQYYDEKNNNSKGDKKDISSKKFSRRMTEIGELLEAFDNQSAKDAFDDLTEKYNLPQEYDEVLSKMKSEFAEANRDKLLELLETFK